MLRWLTINYNIIQLQINDYYYGQCENKRINIFTNSNKNYKISFDKWVENIFGMHKYYQIMCLILNVMKTAMMQAIIYKIIVTTLVVILITLKIKLIMIVVTLLRIWNDIATHGMIKNMRIIRYKQCMNLD